MAVMDGFFKFFPPQMMETSKEQNCKSSTFLRLFSVHCVSTPAHAPISARPRFRLLVFAVAFLKTQEKRSALVLLKVPQISLAIPDTPGTYRSPAMLTLVSKLVHPMALRYGSLGMKLNGMGKKNYFLLVGFHEAIQELQAIHGIMINCALRFQ